MENVIDVAKWFLANNRNVAFPSRRGNIKLQKLLYYSKAMYFAVYDKALFEDTFEAWENGPVAKEAYIEYRHRGLPEKFNMSKCPSFSEDIERVLKVVNHIYGYQTSGSLIDLTHKELPWKELESRVEQRENPLIEDAVIKEYYKPLKDIFMMIDDEEIENTEHVNINGNVFSYDKRSTSLTSEDREILHAYGERTKDSTYSIYKNEDSELVVY